MKKWEKFEGECAVFLSKIVNFKNVTVRQNGGSNSNDGDIDIYYNDEVLTNIECKLSPSQSGQFVIKKQDNNFVLSDKNKNHNEFSEQILNVINQTKNLLKTKNYMEIPLPDNITQHWIVDHYTNKNTDFIITSNNLNSFKAIIPLNEISDYFETKAILRRKKSGSKNIAKKDIDSVKDEVKKFIENKNGRVRGFKENGKKLYVDAFLEKGDDKYKLPNSLLFLRYDYDTKSYVVTKRSNTNNHTVIFEIKYKGPYKDINHYKINDLLRKKLETFD